MLKHTSSTQKMINKQYHSYYVVLLWHTQMESWRLLRNSCNIVKSQTMLTRSQEYISNQGSKPLHHHDNHQRVLSNPSQKRRTALKELITQNRWHWHQLRGKRLEPWTENYTMSSDLKELRAKKVKVLRQMCA